MDSTTFKDLESHFEIVGSKGVLIKLDPLNETTLTQGGIHIPAYENGYTEGGRPASKLSHQKFSTIGTVVCVSSHAAQACSLEGFSLQAGDKVALHPQAKSDHNWFILPHLRSNPVNEFDGYILIQPNLIQAKIY